MTRGIRCGAATPRRRWPHGIAGCVVVALAMLVALPAAAGVPVQGQGVDDERPFEAELLSLTSDRAELRLSDGKAWTLARRDLWWLEVRPTPPTATPPAASPLTVRRATLFLANGDRLGVERLEIRDDAAIGTRADVTGDLSVPLEFLQAVLFDETDTPQQGPMRRWLRRAPVTRDVVLLQNGDRMDGELRTLTDAECIVATAAGETSIDRRRITGIAFNRELMTKPPIAARPVRVQLSDGSLLTAAEVVVGEETFSVTAASGVALSLPFAAVERLDFLGERVVALSMLPVLNDQSHGYLQEAVPLEMDGNAAGGPLQLTREFRGWGLGVWSGSDLTWELPAGAARFHAVVGLDADAAAGGSVEFVVRVDGREAARTGRRAGTDAPQEIGPVLLQDVRRLRLVVEFSDRGDVLDMADWLRPTLLMNADVVTPPSAPGQ